MFQIMSKAGSDVADRVKFNAVSDDKRQVSGVLPGHFIFASAKRETDLRTLVACCNRKHLRSRLHVMQVRVTRGDEMV